MVEIVGRITSIVGTSHFTISDETGTELVSHSRSYGCQCGDTIRLTALILKHNSGSVDVYSRHVEILKRDPLRVVPKKVAARDLVNNTYDYETVEIKGTVTDAFCDEIDPAYTFITLESEDSAVVLFFREPTTDIQTFRKLIDTEVEATGVCLPEIGSFRCQLKYAVLAIDPKTGLKSTGIKSNRLPHRKDITGTVLASLSNRAIYLAHANGRDRIKVYLSSDDQLPTVGQQIVASGFVRKNIFFASLFNSRISILPQTNPKKTETPIPISPRNLLYDSNGKLKIKVNHEGHAISITGTVVDVSNPTTSEAYLTLNCDNIRIPVRLAQMTSPKIGSTINATGICSINTVSDGNPHGFVRLTGFTLLTRGPEDIVILKNPPWWTPAKMLAVIAALLMLVVAVLIWNKSLRALAERRGRELMDEQLGRVSADLKVNERTRLAVELHDALSQNLTGVSLQLDAVKRFADEDRGKMTRHLNMAMRTLKSCRDELRNCLWDLRNRALEETDMNEAIRRTASPFVGDAALLIRFNVPRDQISDNTAHALMRIIRELATNAVRHGAAKTIRIAGALENGRLLFSVSDDGGGFDPQRHPGVDEGHFGLDGIRERISRFDGTLEIESAPGRGATIRISMTA